MIWPNNILTGVMPWRLNQWHAHQHQHTQTAIAHVASCARCCAGGEGSSCTTTLPKPCKQVSRGIRHVREDGQHMQHMRGLMRCAAAAPGRPTCLQHTCVIAGSLSACHTTLSTTRAAIRQDGTLPTRLCCMGCRPAATLPVVHQTGCGARAESRSHQLFVPS